MLFSNAKSGTVLSSGTYAYNTDGNQRQKTELGVTTTYTYDGAGRLTSESSTNGNITYGYDARGNRTSMTRGSTTTTYAYDLNNRLLSETTGTTVKNYTYDVDGNTLTAGNESYTYDVRNRQIGYTDGTTTASYAYNPKGLRSQKTVGGATKYFVWDGMNIVYEYDASAGTAYYYGLHRVSAGNSLYYLYNAHGDVVQLTDGTGAVTKSYAYDAFGNEVNPSANDTNPFRYCGEYYDVETGTIYLRARYYDPTTGRFTQQDAWAFMDASDPLGLNLYLYCLANPVMYSDFTGNMPTKVLNGLLKLYYDGTISSEELAGSAVLFNGGNLKVALHEIAQVIAANSIMKTNPYIELEHRYQTVISAIEFDIFDYSSNVFWEVKPFHLIFSGYDQVLKYKLMTNYYPGYSFPNVGNVHLGYNIYMDVQSFFNGVVTYSLYREEDGVRETVSNTAFYALFKKNRDELNNKYPKRPELNLTSIIPSEIKLVAVQMAAMGAIIGLQKISYKSLTQ